MSKVSEGGRDSSGNSAPNSLPALEQASGLPQFDNLLADPEPWRALRRPGGEQEALSGTVDLLHRLQLHRVAPRWCGRMVAQLEHYRQVHDGLSTQAGDPMPPELFAQWGAELTSLLKLKDLRVEVVPNELAPDRLGQSLPDGLAHDRTLTPLAYLRNDTLQLKAALFSGHDLEAVRDRVSVVIGKMLALKQVNEEPTSLKVMLLKGVARSLGFKERQDQREVAANLLNLSRFGYYRRVKRELSSLALIPPLSCEVLIGESDINLPGLKRQAALGQAAGEMGKGSSLAALHPDDAKRLSIVYRWVHTLSNSSSRSGSEYAFAVATQVAFATRSLGGSIEAIAGALLTALSPTVRQEFAARKSHTDWEVRAVSLADASDDLFTRVFRPAPERPGLKLSHAAENARGVFLQRTTRIARDHAVSNADLLALVFARDLRESAYRWRDVKAESLEPLYRKMILRSAMVASSLLHGREGWYVETVRDEAFRVRNPEQYKRARDHTRRLVGTSFGASIMRLHQDDKAIYGTLHNDFNVNPVLVISGEKSVYAVGSKDRELRDLCRRRIILKSGDEVAALASDEGSDVSSFIKMFWQMPSDIAPPRRDRWNTELGSVRLNVLRPNTQREGHLVMEELNIMSLPWYDVYSRGDVGYLAYWQYKSNSWTDAGFPKQDFQVVGPSILKKDGSSILPWQDYLSRSVNELAKSVYIEVLEGAKGETEAALERSVLRSCQLPREARGIDLLARYGLHPNEWQVQEVNVTSIGEGAPRAEIVELNMIGARSRLPLGGSFRFVRRPLEERVAQAGEDLTIFADGRSLPAKMLSLALSERDQRAAEDKGRDLVVEKYGEIDARFIELVVEPAAEHLGLRSSAELFRAIGCSTRFSEQVFNFEIKPRVARHYVEAQVAIDYGARRWAVKLNQDQVGMLERYLECARDAGLDLLSFSSKSTDIGDGCQITFEFDRTAAEIGLRRFVAVARGVRFERTTNSKELPVYAPVVRDLDFLLVDRPYVALEVARRFASDGYRIISFEVAAQALRRDKVFHLLRPVKVSTIGPDSYLPSSEESIAKASNELARRLGELTLGQVSEKGSAKRQAKERRRQALVHELKISSK